VVYVIKYYIMPHVGLIFVQRLVEILSFGHRSLVV